MLIALLLATASLPSMDDIPERAPEDIEYCRKMAEKLELYVADLDGFITSQEVGNGRYRSFTYQQSREIRYTAQATMRPYIEYIREIAWLGKRERCRIFAEEGRDAVYRKVIEPALKK